MVQAAEIEPSDTVLEIGPGLGVLTEELARDGAPVMAIELDFALAQGLRDFLGASANVHIHQGDALTVDIGSLVREPYVVVSSLPYQAATRILMRLLLERPRPRRMVVMLQEEVARRMVMQTGIGNYLGMALAAVATVSLVRRVPPGAFHPVPKVRSAVVRLDVLTQPAVEVGNIEPFFAFLRAGFAQPRQQLHNSLAQGLDIPVGVARRLVTSVGQDPTRRPGQLTLEGWAALFRARD
jgi:16S rRNA (adenine1518-N6/adenine1519-N6)-dimethyltransferase